MKLNQKVRYAVACLFELSKHLCEFIDADTIASKQTIPAAYAHKVLQALARAGIVVSQKGVGYKLARPLADITALQVIETMTADVDPNASNSDMGMLFEARINKILEGVTLGEVLCK
jgi:Rrf2 family protein